MTAPVVAAQAAGAEATGAAASSSTTAAAKNSSSKVTTRAKSGGTTARKKGGGKAADTAAGATGGPSLSGTAKASAKRFKRLPAARRALVAEFVVCALILALSPLTARHHEDTPGRWVKRASAIAALFVILGLVSTGGPRAAKLAAGLGGLVTLTLLVSDRDVFVALAQRFNAGPSLGPSGPPANPDATPDEGDRPAPAPGPGARPVRPPGGRFAHLPGRADDL